jgi:monoamine oxidase
VVGTMATKASYPHVPVATQLARIKKANNQHDPKHVHILGAGIAGLAAAQVLSQEGHKVTIYEASSRVGGRILTHRFGRESEQLYGELGAMRIPAGHDYTLYFIHQQKLRLRPFITLFENDKAFYHMRGVIARMYERQEKITPLYRLSQWERTMASSEEPGGAALFGWHLNALIHLFSPDEVQGMFKGDMFSAGLRQLDAISLNDFFKAHAVGADAIEYMGNFTGLHCWPEMSVGMFLRDTIVDTSTGLKEVVGGLDLLPRGIAAGLPPQTIHLRTECIEIRNRKDKDKVELILRDNAGHTCTVESDYVLCTIPSLCSAGCNCQDSRPTRSVRSAL